MVSCEAYGPSRLTDTSVSGNMVDSMGHALAVQFGHTFQICLGLDRVCAPYNGGIYLIIDFWHTLNGWNAILSSPTKFQRCRATFVA